jgi:hypothetical protein
MKLGIYITAPVPISMAYSINPTPLIINLCVCMCIPYYCSATARYKLYSGNEYTRNNRRIFGRVVFYAVRVVSRRVGYQFFQHFLSCNNINCIQNECMYIFSHP